MITKLYCMNITSKDPKALTDFYRMIGAPVFVEKVKQINGQGCTNCLSAVCNGSIISV